MPASVSHRVAVALLTCAASFGAAGSLAAQTPAASASADPFVGSWQGALDVGNGRALRIAIALRDSAGALAGTITSIDQGNVTLPASFVRRGDTLVVTVPSAGARFEGVLTAARDSVRGTFTQGGEGTPLAFGRVRAASAPTTPVAPAARARPQDPKPPFPYRAEEVTVESAPGVRLAGTLVVPEGRGPFPAVVLVSGSGPQDRDVSLAGHRPFLVVADHLARHGIASLRYDDRGTAHSTGNHAAATSADLAIDAEAVVRWLRTRPEIARDRVGIVGHSEGGLIGPMVAARTRDVAFVVMLAGPALRGDSLLALQQAAAQRAAGMPEPLVVESVRNASRLRSAVASARDSADAVARFDTAVRALVAEQPEPARAALQAQLAAQRQVVTSPWMRYFLTYDPAPDLRRVRVPVLALNGTLDVQVPATENLAAIRAALTAGGNRDHTQTALPGLNHLFQTARTGGPAEYPQIEETVAPAALDAMTGWIVKRFVR